MRGSLGGIRVNSSEQAPTMAGSLASCQKLSLTPGKAGSTNYTKKWYHGGRGRGMTASFQPVFFADGPLKPLILRKKGFCRTLSIRNFKSHSPQEVEQECSIYKKGKRKLSSAAGKLHLSSGDRKRARGQTGTLGWTEPRPPPHLWSRPSAT